MLEPQEMRMVTANASIITHAPATVAEIFRRIGRMRTGDVAMQWKIV